MMEYVEKSDAEAVGYKLYPKEDSVTRSDSTYNVTVISGRDTQR